MLIKSKSIKLRVVIYFAFKELDLSLYLFIRLYLIQPLTDFPEDQILRVIKMLIELFTFIDFIPHQ